MATKKIDKPTFTVQVRVVLVADVEVEAPSLEDAIAFGKEFKLKDVVTLDSAASECDSKVSVVGAYSQATWGTD